MIKLKVKKKKKDFVEPELIKYKEKLDKVTMGPFGSSDTPPGGPSAP